jgi:choline-sulfatase
MHGKGGAPHDAMFSWYRTFQRAVRTDEYKLIVYSQVGKTQLFDVQKDAWETHDLADSRDPVAVRQKLMERLRGRSNAGGGIAALPKHKPLARGEIQE